MSKLFTVKDFIVHNSPCFNCGKKPSLTIGVINKENLFISYRTTITHSNHLEIPIVISYNYNVSLKVIYKTNYFSSSDDDKLVKFLFNYDLHFQSRCECGTFFVSQNLVFDWQKKQIKAVELSREQLIIHDQENMHIIGSFYDDQKTYIYLYNPLKRTLKIPLFVRSDFKDKEELLKKLRIYMAFL